MQNNALKPKDLISKRKKIMTEFPRKGTYVRHIDSACLSHQLFKTGLTLNCHNALSLDFTALTQLCFYVALYMYILAL